MSLVNKVRNFVATNYDAREEGQGMVEYTLIVGTISIVIVGAFLLTGITEAIGDLATRIGTLIGG